MKATLWVYEKKIYKRDTILEMKLWSVQKSKSYPDGIKYSLIVIDIENNKRVLMDNHRPKGHHYHIDDDEFSYTYITIDRLLEDFKSLVKLHMGIGL